MIRVWIETASAVTRAGLESLLESTGAVDLVESVSQAEAILTDELPSSDDGFEGLPRVVLSDERLTTRLTTRLVAWGVRAVLPREAAPDQIAAALQAAAAGLVTLPVEISASMLPAAAEILEENLTPREIEVLEMLAEGWSNKQIAGHLKISEHTAKFHVNSILNKLGAGTRTEAVMRALRRGLVRV